MTKSCVAWAVVGAFLIGLAIWLWGRAPGGHLASVAFGAGGLIALFDAGTRYRERRWIK